MANELSKRAALVARLDARGLSLFWHDTLDSTNNEAKRRAHELPVPAVLVADAQSAGRGRMGRSFFSPQGTGLYFSYLTEICEQATTVGMTAAAAVATARAIRRTTGVETEIKWVNDLLLDGKKVAGILCESFGADDRRFAVIGIGINLESPSGGFPAELQRKAGALDVAAYDREALVEALAEELHALVCALPDKGFMQEYRARSAVLGRRVRYTVNGSEHEAEAIAIDDGGVLLVRHADGAEATLASGEISLSYEWFESNEIREG